MKNAKELLSGFYENLENINGIDKKIAQLLKELYETDNFTEKIILNKLSEPEDQSK